MRVRETALAELAELRAERDIKASELEILNQEIVRLEQAVASLSPLASDGEDVMHVGIVVEGVAKLNLADACRAILKHNPTYRTARGIRDSLRDSGYNLDQHTNHLASIHGILKRLADSGEVEQLESEGRTRYRWKGSAVVTGPLMPPPRLTRKQLRKQQEQAENGPIGPSRFPPPRRLKRNALQEFAKSLEKGETENQLLNAVIKAGTTE
jgi:hypothetical protein